MRFRLLETKNLNIIEDAEKLTDDTVSLKEKQSIAEKLLTELKIGNCPITDLSQKVNDSNHPIFEIVQELFYNHNKNPQVCQIFKYLPIDEIKTDFFDNISKVVQGLANIDSNRIEKLKPIVSDVSLYERKPKDFNYSYKLLSILISPTQIKKYFKNPKIVNFDELMIDGHLKPAGIDTMDESNDTLFGTIRSWTAGKSGASDNSMRNNTNGKEVDNPSNELVTFASFEDAAEELGDPAAGQVIHIDGEFEFDKNHASESAKGWKPIS